MVVSRRVALEARLRPHMKEDTDYARLLRWRLLTPEERPVDPYGTTMQEQAADLIIRAEMNKYEIEHAYDLDPWHPLIHLALAGFEKDPLRAGFSATVFARSTAERSETLPSRGRVPA
jgi:hypothetical protein